jgi:hypothetical protein
MMAVAIETEPAFTAGIPKELFKGRYLQSHPLRSYDVAPDGQRFLMIRDVSQPEEPITEIHVVLNWFEELKRLVPTN